MTRSRPVCYRQSVRVLALDHGERRIGVAVTDPLGIAAQPLETLRRRRGSDAHLRRIVELCREYEVEQIVVGLPIHMDGRRGPEVDAARAFGREVAERTGIAVDYVDERWTTREARRTLHALGARGRRGRERLDPVAASLILQSYLEGARA